MKRCLNGEDTDRVFWNPHLPQRPVLCQRPGLNLAYADAETLLFTDSSFDALLSINALEHSVNPVHMLSEVIRVVCPGSRIVLLRPGWDFPFWHPNSLLTPALNSFKRLRYTVKRVVAQALALLGDTLPFLISEDPKASVVWSFEVIRQVKSRGCMLAHAETGTRLLGANPFLCLARPALMLLPSYRNAGGTSLLVFQR